MTRLFCSFIGPPVIMQICTSRCSPVQRCHNELIGALLTSRYVWCSTELCSTKDPSESRTEVLQGAAGGRKSDSPLKHVQAEAEVRNSVRTGRACASQQLLLNLLSTRPSASSLLLSHNPLPCDNITSLPKPDNALTTSAAPHAEVQEIVRHSFALLSRTCPVKEHTESFQPPPPCQKRTHSITITSSLH